MTYKQFVSVILLSMIQINPSFAQVDALLALSENNASPVTPPTNAEHSSQKNNQAPWFVKKYQFQAGLFMPLNNTNIRVGSATNVLSTDIDFENDLGYNTYSFSAYTGFQWHISRRFRLDLNYFYIGRSTDHVLDKTIEFADKTYPIYADLRSFFNSHIGRVSLGYAFFSRPKYEAGIMLGTHIIQSNIGMGLNTNVGSITYSSDYGFTAPLPDAGIYGGYAINDQWAIHGDVSYLSMTISNISGKIINYNISVQYNPVADLSFSLSYTGLNFELDVYGDDLNGYIKWGYQGPALTAIYTLGKGF